MHTLSHECPNTKRNAFQKAHIINKMHGTLTLTHGLLVLEMCLVSGPVLKQEVCNTGFQNVTKIKANV